jgi:uncharacterized protein
MVMTEEKQAEIAARRQRYEELRVAGQTRAPRALPPPTPLADCPIPQAAIMAGETVPGGWYWTTTMARGEALRLINTSGTSAVALLAWNRLDRSERLNLADTIKVQWSSVIRKGRILLSDMGRVLLSVIEDSCFAHDALVGGSTAASTLAKYGGGAFRNTRDNFIAAAAKCGFDRRDIGPCITFFAPVVVTAEGQFGWDESRRRVGDFVDLRAEMELDVIISNCPHPLDPNPAYAPGPIDVIRFKATTSSTEDLCRTATVEAIRAFENTDALSRG